MSLASLIEKYREMKSDAEQWRAHVENLEDATNAKLRRISGAWEYNQAISKAQLWLETMDLKQDQLDFIDFLMGIIRADIQTDYQAVIIYFTELEDLKDCQLPYPLIFYDENNVKHLLDKKDEHKELDLSKDSIIVWPWKFEKIANLFLNLKYHDFESNNHRHKLVFFQGVELACVNKGNHSIMTGISFKKGNVVAREVYDITELFQHVDTNGVKWINRHNREIIQRVSDFRFAILYELARMKYEIKLNTQ